MLEVHNSTWLTNRHHLLLLIGWLIAVQFSYTVDVYNKRLKYRLLLLTPAQLFGHDLHDAWEGFVGRLHVQEAQAGAASDDVDGRAGVLLDGVENLKDREPAISPVWTDYLNNLSGFYLRLDVWELGHKPLPHNGPALPGHLSHLGHIERFCAVCGRQVLCDLQSCMKTRITDVAIQRFK